MPNQDEDPSPRARRAHAVTRFSLHPNRTRILLLSLFSVSGVSEVAAAIKCVKIMFMAGDKAAARQPIQPLESHRM